MAYGTQSLNKTRFNLFSITHYINLVETVALPIKQLQDIHVHVIT